MEHCPVCFRARHAPDIVCAGVEPSADPSTTQPVDSHQNGERAFHQVTLDELLGLFQPSLQRPDDLSSERVIEWLVPQAQAWPYLREVLVFWPDPIDVQVERTRGSNWFIVAVALLDPDAPYAYPPEDDAPAYWWRRTWQARLYDPYGPCAPCEAVDPASLSPGHPSQRVVRWEAAA